MLCTSLANHQKHSATPWGHGGRSLWAGLSSCPPLASLHAVPPSGLFIVESVFICFIMKNKFAEVY